MKNDFYRKQYTPTVGKPSVLTEKFPDEVYKLRIQRDVAVKFTRKGTAKEGVVVEPPGERKYHLGALGDWLWMKRAMELFPNPQSPFWVWENGEKVFIQGIISFTEISEAMGMAYGDMPQTSSNRLRRCWRRGWIRRFKNDVKNGKVYYLFEEMTDEQYGLPRIRENDLRHRR